jgi:hypothetical protein
MRPERSTQATHAGRQIGVLPVAPWLPYTFFVPLTYWSVREIYGLPADVRLAGWVTLIASFVGAAAFAGATIQRLREQQTAEYTRRIPAIRMAALIMAALAAALPVAAAAVHLTRMYPLVVLGILNAVGGLTLTLLAVARHPEWPEQRRAAG